MSEEAAKRIINTVNTVDKPVLGLATGSTPEGLYQRLIEQYQKEQVTFQNTTTFNLDEYVGLSKDDPNSYHYYMHDKLFNHIDIPMEQAHVPSGDDADLTNDCEKYESRIQTAGK